VRAVALSDGRAGEDRVARDARPAGRRAPGTDHDRPVGRDAAAPASGGAYGLSGRRDLSAERPFEEVREPRLGAGDLERVEVGAHREADALDADRELGGRGAEVGRDGMALAHDHHAAGQPQAVGDGGPGDFSAGGGHGSAR